MEWRVKEGVTRMRGMWKTFADRLRWLLVFDIVFGRVEGRTHSLSRRRCRIFLPLLMGFACWWSGGSQGDYEKTRDKRERGELVLFC